MQRAFGVVLVVACSAHDAPPPQLPAAPPPVVAIVPPPSVKAPGLRLPDGVTPLGYDLRLEVDPSAESFRGTVAIDVRIDAPTDHLWIHADELEIATARYRDGARTAPLVPLATAGDQMRGFGLGATLDHRTITLDFEFTGHTGHDEEGLFRQRDRDRWYLFSQGESIFARRITPCFDEPRFKTPWKLTLVIPKTERGFSNMPVAHEADLADGRHELAFAATPPMPSYLLALAVGPFEIVDAGTVGKQHLPLRVVALAGDRERVGVAAKRVPGLVDAIEAYTGEPLAWPKLDLLSVPHLFGAMENPGLITFDGPVIVGDARSRGFSAYFTRIVAHELAHQWFGNLVTPAWWDDLWLSESFASWLGDRVVAQVGGFDQPLLRRALTREHALEADAEPSARPLRHAVERNDDPDNPFDTIAYDKGEVVLSMFEAWVGEEPFRTALRAYLHDHRDGNATTSDLIAAIAAASTPLAAHALAAYVDHAGAPVVELALDCTGPPTLRAHARDGMTIPVCVRYAGGRGPERACELVGDHTDLALSATTSCPKWVYATDNGYYHVAWSTNGPRGPAPPLAQLAASERIALGDDLAASIERGEIAIPAALAQLRDLAASHDLYGEYAAVAIARVIDAVVDDPTRDAWAGWLGARFASRFAPALWFASPRNVLDARIRDDLARIVADHAPGPIVQHARGLIEAALAHHHAPDPLAVAITGGDRGTFDALVALARTPDDDRRDAAFDALGEFGQPLAASAIGLVASDLAAKSTLAIAASYFERGATRSAAWTTVRTRLPELLAHLSGVEAGELIDDAASLCEPAARTEVAAAFEPHVGEIFDSRRRLARTLGAIDRCIARRTRAGDVAAALR